MKLLLTSAGVRNTSIQDALVDLLGKPIAESGALCIPTAQYGHPQIGPGEGAWRFITGRSDLPMCGLGWKSVGVLELTALPSIDGDHWVPKVEGQTSCSCRAETRCTSVTGCGSPGWRISCRH